MFKTLKDARRRAVESILETVGASEVTTDPEFDQISSKFDNVIQELNLCSSTLQHMLASQKVFFNDCKDLSVVIHRVYQSNTQEESSWPSHERYRLQYESATEEYQKAWETIHNIIRPSVATVCVEDANDSLKTSSANMGRSVEEQVRARKSSLKDFDSYRRRLKTLQTKRDTLESQKKDVTDTLSEIERFEAKVHTAEEVYHSDNTKVKQDMLSYKETHDQLLDSYFITILTAQSELFLKAYEYNEKILRMLPEDRVEEVRSKIQSQMRADGTSITAQAKEKKTSTTSFSKSVASTNQESSSSMTKSEPVKVVSPPISPPTVSPSRTKDVPKKEYAIALYDNDVDDEEELSFKQGQRIEVIEKDDSGWYKGSLEGRVGLFPVNYVKLEN